MSKNIEVKLPKLGESILSATVVRWFKQEGDTIKLDEPLLEVATDKVNSEIPSPVEGVLTKALASPDQELDVGETLALIDTQERAFQSQEPNIESDSNEMEEAITSNKGFFTPLVKKIAKQKGVSLEILKSIPGTGAGGRLSKLDLENYLNAEESHSKNVEADQAMHIDDTIKMSPMRKKIAKAMVDSYFTAPHATLVNEVDVTRITKHLKSNKQQFLENNGFKLSITSFIAWAISGAAVKYPIMNSQHNNDVITLSKTVNLGLAVDVEKGIQVPVIRNCNKLSIAEIAQLISQLSNKARKSQLLPEDILKGTITMTNFGMTGTLIGTPIIRQPEVAIVGAGAIVKKVVPLEDETIGIRSTMHLSLSFDHRIIDGMLGCAFLKEIKDLLENIDFKTI